MSLWSWVNRPEELNRFKNPLFEANSLVIWPSVAPQSLQLWEGTSSPSRFGGLRTSDLLFFLIGDVSYLPLRQVWSQSFIPILQVGFCHMFSMERVQKHEYQIALAGWSMCIYYFSTMIRKSEVLPPLLYITSPALIGIRRSALFLLPLEK